jgi:hypothetical protein
MHERNVIIEYFWLQIVSALWIKFPRVTKHLRASFNKISTGRCFEIISIFSIKISTHSGHLIKLFDSQFFSSLDPLRDMACKSYLYDIKLTKPFHCWLSVIVTSLILSQRTDSFKSATSIMMKCPFFLTAILKLSTI